MKFLIILGNLIDTLGGIMASKRNALSIADVLNVAEKRVERDGFENLTLTSVANDLGIRTPSVYSHIESLQDLRNQLALRAFTLVRKTVRASGLGHSREDAVRTVANGIRLFAQKRPGLYACMIGSRASEDEHVKRASHDLGDALRSVLVGYDFDRVASVHATRVLRSAVHGFVTLEASGWFANPVRRDDSFECLVDFVVAGLADVTKRSKR